MCLVASCAPPTGDLAHNPGVCSEWELNRQLFGLQACAPSTELHQPGPVFKTYYIVFPLTLLCVNLPLFKYLPILVLLKWQDKEGKSRSNVISGKTVSWCGIITALEKDRDHSLRRCKPYHRRDQ